MDNNKSTDDQNANLTLEDRNESQKATTDQPESSETESVNESPQQSEQPEQATVDQAPESQKATTDQPESSETESVNESPQQSEQPEQATVDQAPESQKATTDQPESSEAESVNEISGSQEGLVEKASPGNTAWYIAHVYSGFEKKVSDLIREQARHKGVEDAFEEILIPTQDVVELRRGKRVNLEKKVFPGYVLLKMRMDDETWHLVNNTAKVTGFLGGGNGMAAPISQDEVNQILNQTKIGKEKSKPLVTFEVGEQVRVCDGPFNSFNGFVEEVDEEKSRLKVSVSIFGRSTPVELEYSQVEKG